MHAVRIRKKVRCAASSTRGEVDTMGRLQGCGRRCYGSTVGKESESVLSFEPGVFFWLPQNIVLPKISNQSRNRAPRHLSTLLSNSLRIETPNQASNLPTLPKTEDSHLKQSFSQIHRTSPKTSQNKVQPWLLLHLCLPSEPTMLLERQRWSSLATTKIASSSSLLRGWFLNFF